MTTKDLSDQFADVKPGDVGIMGDPIEHSLSPLMQNAAFKTWAGAFRDREEPTPTYHRFLVKPAELEEAIQLMKEVRMRGMNVTIPHKVAACKYVDIMSPFAQKVGAINTLSFVERKLSGLNTDAEGFKHAVSRDLEFDPEGKTVLVLGAGGTGRVITHSLLDLEAAKVFLWNRTQTKLDEFGTGQGHERIRPVHSQSDVMEAMKEAELVVNATSVGLNEKDDLPVDGLKFSSHQFVFDVIYHRETTFLKRAKAAGAKVSGGLGMLVYQGAKSFEVWTGTPAPVEIMKSVLVQVHQGV